MSGWACAHRRHHSHPVAAVLSVRCWTVNTACVLAFRAAHTFTRWRPEGALTKSRWQHQTRPQKGANTTGAASMKNPGRWPAPAACHLGSRLFFQRLLGVHGGLGGDHADVPRLHPQRSQQLPHVGGLAHHPGDFGDRRRGFRHCRRRMLRDALGRATGSRTRGRSSRRRWARRTST